jgi:hypothetical protein
MSGMSALFLAACAVRTLTLVLPPVVPLTILVKSANKLNA